MGGAGEGRGRFREGKAGPIIFDLASAIAYGWSGWVWAKSMAQEGGAAAFGEELRRAREERGVAVEAICAATKVPARHIRALEAGALGELPGGVFRRGFVRSYLGALGLEEDAWMRRFEESCRQSGVGEPARDGVGRIRGKRQKQPGCAAPPHGHEVAEGGGGAGGAGAGGVVRMAAGHPPGADPRDTGLEGFEVFC